jgi:hypothetical protein
MKITTANSWMLSATVAPAVRFMQDQQLVHAADLAYAACYATRVASRIEATDVTAKQLETLNKIIAERGWIEPPRWRPWTEVVGGTIWWDRDRLRGDYYRITACPGAVDRDELKALMAERPEGMPCEITIGDLYEYTRDADDPRLQPTPLERRRGKRARYTTICRRLVERARELGKLIEQS